MFSICPTHDLQFSEFYEVRLRSYARHGSIAPSSYQL